MFTMDVDNYHNITEDEYDVHIRETLISAQIPRVNHFLIWLQLEQDAVEFTRDAVSITEVVSAVFELDPETVEAIEVTQFFPGIDRMGRSLLIPFTIHRWNKSDCRIESFFTYFIELMVEGIRMDLRI